jgi:hypothetical protein
MIVSVAGGNDEQLNWGARMEYNIRQLSFGEVLDRSLRILIENPVLLIGVSLVLGLPAAMLQHAGKVAGGTLAVIYLLLVSPLVLAALTSAIADTYLNKPVTIAGAYQEAWSIVLPFIGTYLLLYLILGLIFGGIFGLAFASGMAVRGSGGGGAVFVLLFLVSFVILSYLGIRWSLIGPIMIVERRFAMKALSRSSELVTGAWWRTFGILLVAGLIVRVPLSVLELFWASIPVLGGILSGLVASIAAAYSGIAVVVYYFDRRCRLEDFDLRRLAEQIRSETVQGTAAITGAPSV